MPGAPHSPAGESVPPYAPASQQPDGGFSGTVRPCLPTAGAPNLLAMNGVIYLREEQPRLWQASPDRVQWTTLVQGSTEVALEQARITFSRQLVAITSCRLTGGLIA